MVVLVGLCSPAWHIKFRGVVSYQALLNNWRRSTRARRIPNLVVVARAILRFASAPCSQVQWDSLLISESGTSGGGVRKGESSKSNGGQGSARRSKESKQPAEGIRYSENGFCLCGLAALRGQKTLVRVARIGLGRKSFRC